MGLAAVPHTRIAISCGTGTVEAKDLKCAVGDNVPFFGDYGKHDSHEFLMTLLDELHQDLKQSETALGNDSQLQRPSEREHQAKTDCSTIAERCYGWSRTTLVFKCCGCRKEIEEPLLSWTLPILSRKGSYRISRILCYVSRDLA
jgi:ubiquitin C-terminal hydrolase